MPTTTERTTTDVPPRVQLSRRAGWHMPPNTIKVDRTTKFGNPFDHRGPGRNRAIAIAEYEAWLNGEGPDEMPAGHHTVSRSWVLDHLDELAGHRLACWCPLDGPCHADVLAARANALAHRR
ncbi:MAG: DUF4326 domain-containing protein [Frankia sp.]|nr:DUF4326 domain-containing protein [Frankia sp.]